MNNKEFTFKGTLKEGVSQKGNTYEYLDLKLTNDYSKRVYLEQAEKLLLLNNSKTTNPFGNYVNI